MAIVTILEDIVSAEYLENKLSVLLPSGNRVTEPGILRKQLGSRDDGVGDDRREFRRVFLQEGGETIEVSECVVRPVDGYRPGHGR